MFRMNDHCPHTTRYQSRKYPVDGLGSAFMFLARTVKVGSCIWRISAQSEDRSVLAEIFQVTVESRVLLGPTTPLDGR
jgi:hypothetical protein